MNKENTGIFRKLAGNRMVRGILLGFLIFAAVMIGRELGFFRQLEWKSWDLRLRLWHDPGRAGKKSAIILIDQDSLDFYEKQGVSWPWPREMYAYLVRYLHQGQAKAVVFDLIFSEPSFYGEGDDMAFAESMTSHGHVFLPVFLSGEHKTGQEKNRIALESFSVSEKNIKESIKEPVHSVTLPGRILMNGARGVGNVRIPPDDDGIFRRLPLFFDYKGLVLPVLALAVARDLSPGGLTANEEGRVFFKERPIPLDSSGRMVLLFHGPQGTYPSYSAAAVLNSMALMEEGKPPQLPPEIFAGKVVFIGASAPGLYDLHSSPLCAVYPGVEIHATALDNLMSGDFVDLPGWEVNALFIFVLSVMTAWGISSLKKTRWVVLFGLGCLFLPTGAAFLTFKSGIWLDFVPPIAAAALAFTVASLLNYSLEGKEKRFLKRSFQYYLSPLVIERITRDPGLLSLGGEEREITSFFSDIAGFTSISEALSPQELVHFLNIYLTEMTETILSYEGMVDKYEGDAIIAFWNAPLDQENHALRACRAALECQKKLEVLRPEIKDRFGVDVFTRIGLNSGPAVVGNMGSRRRFDYTAIGDTVNLASRLEGACKLYGIPIMAGEITADKVKDHVILREIDCVRVVGKEQAVRIYEVCGNPAEMSQEEKSLIDVFHNGLSAYRRREWKSAVEYFKKYENDGPSRIYTERCSRFSCNEPAKDWTGIHILTSK
ncbi:MAG: adenylate/guanylate cyclase domain-containing protein [Candidatus Aminicenantes bacterium]|nr:adenylate/guanylate cyclase domain-containing protein [Candidatus Aminicenantes bacterium]